MVAFLGSHGTLEPSAGDPRGNHRRHTEVALTLTNAGICCLYTGGRVRNTQPAAVYWFSHHNIGGGRGYGTVEGLLKTGTKGDTEKGHRTEEGGLGGNAVMGTSRYRGKIWIGQGVGSVDGCRIRIARYKTETELENPHLIQRG